MVFYELNSLCIKGIIIRCYLKNPSNKKLYIRFYKPLKNLLTQVYDGIKVKDGYLSKGILVSLRSKNVCKGFFDL